MNKTPRKVSFSTKINLLKRKPFSMILGFGFTVLPLFIVTIPLIIYSSLGYETPKVDYDLISSNGKPIKAEITDIETQYNLTVNGINPTIISYKYLNNGKETRSKFKVLEERKIEKLEIGDSIDLLELDGKSIIKDLNPYISSIGFLFLFPIPFLIVGVPFLICSTKKLNKEVKLYKYGNVSKGKIVSMIPKSGLPVSSVGQGIVVHYEYEKRNGTKNLGESFTTDFSIINDKKKDDLTPIFVSPENENKSCIIPKLESLRNGWNINFE